MQVDMSKWRGCDKERGHIELLPGWLWSALREGNWAAIYITWCGEHLCPFFLKAVRVFDMLVGNK